MALTKTFNYDLGFVQAGLDGLQEYLLSKEIFWPLAGNPPAGTPDYPRLTLGALLLSTRRLGSYPPIPGKEGEVHKLVSRLDEVHAKWRVMWENKARQSFSVRLRMWRDFLEDYRTSPQDNTDRYAYEVRLRAMLDLLQNEAGKPLSAEGDLLHSLDAYLQSILVPGAFIWEPEVQSGFPKAEYWYLYGSLPSAPVR